MVYGECRAMEFAFVRNGREETDREKIRAFAEAYGLVLCGELAGANIGRLWPEKTAGRLGLAKAEIARRLGVGRTTLYLYLKRKGNAGQAGEKTDFRPTKQFMTGTEHEH